VPVQPNNSLQLTRLAGEKRGLSWSPGCCGVSVESPEPPGR